MYTVVPTVNAVIRNSEGAVLMGKRGDKPGKPCPNVWDTPGGRIEDNETTEEALRREIQEETGLTITGMRLVSAYHHHGEGIQGLPGLNLCFEVKYSGEISAEDDLKKLEWVAPTKISQLELTPWCKAHFTQLGLLRS